MSQSQFNNAEFQNGSHHRKNKFKIAHSLEELQDELILTLKDTPLLKNQNQLNDDEDMFQNQQLQTNNRLRHNAKLKLKIKEISDVTTSHIQTKLQGKDGILPHYNDYSYKPDQIEVQQTGIITKKIPKAFSNTQSDFLTKEEQLASTKLGAEYSKIKIKNINKMRSASSGGRNSSSDLLSFLNQTAEDKLSQQTSIKRSAQQAIEDALDSIRKKRILEFNAKRQVKNVDISSLLQTSEEEELLNKSLKQSQKNNTRKAQNFILDSIKEEQEGDEQTHKQRLNSNNSMVQIQLNPISYRGQDKKYLRKQFDLNGIKSGTTSAMFVKLPSERLAKKQQQDKGPQSFKDITPQQLQKMKRQVSFLEDKIVGTGLSGTLQYLRQNSLLNKQQQVGRTNDKTINYNDPNDRVKLQYRNTNGKLMKPKQAFRHLCATFHGQGPSQNKIQKRRKRQLEQMRMKETLNTGGQLLSMLSQHQKKSNQAHMVIEIGKKAGNYTKSS